MTKPVVYVDELDEFLGKEFDDAANRSALIRHLVAHRKGSGLSQKDVAKIMGVSRSLVANIEGGDTDPHFSMVQRYSRAIGMVLEWRISVEEGR